MLETYEEIDKKFLFYQKEYQKSQVKLSTQTKQQQRRFAYGASDSIKKSQDQSDCKSIMYQASFSDQPDMIIESARPKSPRTQEFYQFFVDRYFTKPKPKEDTNKAVFIEDVNYLIIQNGDFLSNSLISSLVIMMLKEQFGEKLPRYDHYGTAQKILGEFSISAVTLSNFQTAQERQDYIVRCFDATIDRLMKEWKQKIQQKDKRLHEFDLHMRRIKNTNQKEKNDLFHWLALKTKYKVLQKRLRQMLMEKLDDYENQLKIAVAIRKGEKLKLSGVRKIPIKEMVYKKAIVQSQIPDLSWNEYLEKKFQTEKYRAKQAYCNKIPSSNFNQMGFMAIFDQLEIEDPVHLQREVKMAKYANGDWLSPQEMKFLANTSELLNRCVDQNMIKRAVQHLKKNEISKLETLLSEQIVDNFDMMKSKIQQARQRWLFSHIRQVKSTIDLRDEFRIKQNICIQNKKKNQRFQKTLITVCNKMEKNISIKDQVFRNFFAQIFVRKIMQKVEMIRYQKENYQAQNMYEKEIREQEIKKQEMQQRIFELSRPKSDRPDKRRMYHPSSKVGFLPKPDDEIDFETEQGQRFFKRQKEMKNKEKEYRLSCLDVLKNEKVYFAKFYAGGPQKGIRQEPLIDIQNPLYVPQISKVELQSIVKIQKAIRKFLKQRSLKNYKEIYFQKQYKLYQHKIDELALVTKFQGSVRQVSSQLQNASARIRTVTSRVKSDISVQYKKQLKTEDTAEPSMNYTNKNQKSNQPKHRLIKHDRLLRYSKLNRFNQIIKSGFYYDKQDIDVIDDDKNTALFYAAGFGNFVLVDFLLKNGADPNLQCSDGTPMHQAIKSQSLDVIFRMIDEGGSLNVLNSQNNTPLIYATTSLLKQLGMENAIVTTSSQIPVFDNNELLYK